MSNPIGDFGAIEIAENIYRFLNSWNSRYQFSRVSKSIYIMAANHITDIPFTVEPEDLENKCALPQNTARCVSLTYRLISTPRAIQELIPKVFFKFLFVNKVYILDSTLLSKNCAKVLLQELNKEDRRELQLYVDERDRTRWEYLDNDLKMDRAAKNIKLIFYNEYQKNKTETDCYNNFSSSPNTSITDYEAQKDSIDGTSRIQQVDGDIQETEQGWSLEYLWQNIEKEEETEEEIFGCHTTEGESSASKVVKRKNPYLYSPSASIKRQTTSFYENVMERYIEFGFLELKSHTTVKSCPLPKSSVPLVAQNSQYHSLTTPIDDDIHFTRRGGIDVDGDNIDLNMDRHARQLVECILRGKTSWIFISQIDAFYQNNTIIDDCARKRNHDYYESPRGFIIDKTMHDKSWREIVVRWGNFEFLAIGGYVGLCHGDKRRAFLGSALNKEVIDLINNDTEFNVLVPSAPVPNVQSYRYLRSYAKIAACKPWSYISKRFVRNNFEACHGLAIDQHPTRMNKKFRDRASIASIILRIAAKKIYSNDDRMKILELIEKTKDFHHILIDQWANVKNIVQALNLIEKNLPQSPLLPPLKRVADFDSYHEVSGERVTRITAIVAKRKSSLTELFNTSVYPTMKVCNKDVLEELKK